MKGMRQACRDHVARQTLKRTNAGRLSLSDAGYRYLAKGARTYTGKLGEHLVAGFGATLFFSQIIPRISWRPAVIEQHWPLLISLPRRLLLGRGLWCHPVFLRNAEGCKPSNQGET